MFRQEALRRQAGRLEGEVAIFIPTGWQSISYLFGGGVIAGLLFLLFGFIDRVALVSGTLEPDKGVATIIPSRSGAVASLDVIDGARVKKGEQLATIRVGEELTSGLAVADIAAAAIDRQERGMARQAVAARDAARGHLLEIQAAISAAKGEISEIKAQIALQERLVTLASDDLQRIRAVAKSGFISQRDLEGREDSLIGRQQQLSQLNQALNAKAGILARSQRELYQVGASDRQAQAALESARASLSEHAAVNEGSRYYSVRSPFGGKVVNLVGRLGQSVSSQTPLMEIVPDGSRLQAKLRVPDNQLANLKIGQKVQLSVEAFPKEKFGTIPGHLSLISQASAINSAITDGPHYYACTVELEMTKMEITRFHLLPGMRLSASIVTDHRRVIDWVVGFRRRGVPYL